MSRSVHEISYDLLLKDLRGMLRAAVESGRRARDGVGSIQCRACAVLYALLMDHPVDRRGRCRSCRRPGVVFRWRRRRCRVHREACFYLRNSDDFLLAHLTGELELSAAAGP